MLDINECINRMYNFSRTAMITSRLSFDSKLNINHLYCLDRKDQICSYPISMFVRNDFPHKKYMNTIIEIMFESGIIEFWQRKYKFNKNLDIMNIMIVPLTVEHELGTFLLFSIGLSLGIIAFSLEKIVYSLKQNEKIVGNKKKFLLMLSKILDGERHFFILKDRPHAKPPNSIDI